MRLIDADRLYRIVKTECNPYGKPSIGYEDGNRVLHLIEIAPTVMRRETGEWMPHPNREFREWDVCTACGVGCKRREYEDGGMTEYSYLYCPNCGARMEES